jgi:acetyltransferase
MPGGGLTDLLPSQGYPLELLEVVEVANGQRVTVRPILPLDSAKFQAFVRNLSETSRNHRFLQGLRELQVHVLQRLMRIDYRTHMALVAEVVREGMPIIIAEARYAVDPESNSAELAVAVADSWQGVGLAKALLRRLAGHAAAAGLRRLTGETQASNARVLQLARQAGFSIMPVPGTGGVLRLSRNIAPQSLL